MIRRKTGFGATLVGLIVLIGSHLTCLAAEDIRIISTAELKKWLAADKKPVLVYTLSQIEFYEQRIPGSLCIPPEEMQQSEILPKKRDTPLVFYCLGPG